MFMIMFHLFSDVFPPLVTHGVDSIAFKHDNFLIYLKSLIYCDMCLECKSGMRWLSGNSKPHLDWKPALILIVNLL